MAKKRASNNSQWQRTSTQKNREVRRLGKTWIVYKGFPRG